jgi:release factor glutamine methyltransferase
LRDIFAKAGLDNPALDARILVAEALAIEQSALLIRPETPIDADAAARLADYAARRVAREPVARILGEREFWGLRFWLSPATLVPRPDTETVVRAALAWAKPRRGRLRLLDLGTGTGCLLVALLHELVEATGVGLDRLFEAVCTARRNAERNGVGGRAAFAVSDWAAPIQERFDLVVSNPPYIPSGEISGLDPEVRTHDPRLALDGGDDGLRAYHAVFSDAGRLLAPGGVLVVEFGIGQEAGLRAAAEVTGLLMTGVEADLEGRARAAVLERS